MQPIALKTNVSGSLEGIVTFDIASPEPGAETAFLRRMTLSIVPGAPRRLSGLNLSRFGALRDATTLHVALSAFNERRLQPRFPDLLEGEREISLDEEFEMRTIETAFVEADRAAIASLAAEAPTDAQAFVRWFEALKGTGPGEGDPLFPFLAERASLEQLRWFLEQEVAGEAGFDDLVAMTQVKFEGRPKLEMGNNYWDELGRGKAAGMHGPLLAKMATALDLHPKRDKVVWEALAVGNLLVALATNRRYAYHSVGALGAVELCAPWRAAHVNEALKRCGVDGEFRRYYALHATLDVKHSRQWDDEVLIPLVEQNPRAARAIAEGALMRMQAGARTFDRYRRELGI